MTDELAPPLTVCEALTTPGSLIGRVRLGRALKPGLLPAFACFCLPLFKPRGPSQGAGPTSSKICRCCKVGKIVQADDVDDGAHHTGVVLEEEDGKV